MTQEARPQTAEPMPEFSLSDCKVLFVDDEANILKSLRRLTMDEDFETLTANSGAEGLELLAEEEGVSLIVSDQRMPQMTGAEFLARAKDLYPEIPRIILTGYADVQAAIDAINQGGACRYLKKPWEEKDLLQAIEGELQRYLLVQENRRLHTVINEQNEMLQDWNGRLKSRVMDQTVQIREKNEALYEYNSCLKKTFQATIGAFTGLIELRDSNQHGHAQNVAELVQGMGEALTLGDEVLEPIIQAALLHDIGKIGIPDSLICKTTELMSEEEKREYEQHAVRGQTALGSIEDLRAVGTMVRHHHEWYDGSGFPDGLKGEDIPLGSRMIGLADFVDRSLGEAPSQAKVRTVLIDTQHMAGRCFDANLIKLLKKPVTRIYSTIEVDGQSAMVIEPDELREGMVLAKDIFSGTGLMLIRKGSRIDSEKIPILLRYHRLDPFPQGITILKQDEE